MRISQVFLSALVLLLLAGATAQAQIAHGYSNVFAIDTVMEVDRGDSPSWVTALTSISPNPFNAQTTIEFALAESGAVELTVFDLRGRLVRILDRESRPSGQYRAMWNGCDDEGRAMPAGVYFCRLVSSHEVQTRILNLVK
ncbi:FlgD immunoglobulin-like domain containing protein [Candidatus Eisenbacteria bacterium]|uniref:FlgD immunoglobulin-like domain containing protein n=1 Tax=Eiseniibacteriota bacterium TaxID=2212470 RepID=A0ABV6YJW8_UNCEI